MSQYKNIVVLTGAGISAESGLKTFRDNNGLWENHAVEEVATPEAFNRNPALVYRFYNERRAQLLSAEVSENAAHRAIAQLQQRWPHRVTVITQNVDNLHERAGSTDVLHMHGELLSARCCQSGLSFPVFEDFDHTNLCQCCANPQPIRPDIVWFGEMPKYMAQIEQRLYDADLFISIGTSGHVYPAAGFVQLANEFGAHSIELNLEPSQVQSNFAQCYYGPATQIVPNYVSCLLESLLS